MFFWNQVVSSGLSLFSSIREKTKNYLFNFFNYTLEVIPDPLKKYSLGFVNYLVDGYLDFKYRNHDHSKEIQFDQIPYALTKVKIQALDSLDEIDLPVPRIDLRLNQTCLTGQTLQELILGTLQFDTNLIIKLHFEYNQQEYILPLIYDENLTINLPLYSPDDIDSCFKVEYEKIHIDDCEIDEFSMRTLLKYAGPKGNFYCDTPHKILPKWISSNLHHLRLTTLLGTDHKFSADVPIEIGHGV